MYIAHTMRALRLFSIVSVRQFRFGHSILERRCFNSIQDSKIGLVNSLLISFFANGIIDKYRNLLSDCNGSLEYIVILGFLNSITVFFCQRASTVRAEKFILDNTLFLVYRCIIKDNLTRTTGTDENIRPDGVVNPTHNWLARYTNYWFSILTDMLSFIHP